MKTLVIGGTQFVGLHLVYELVARGHDVTVLNRGMTKASLPPGTKRLVCDRKEHEALRTCLRGKEYDAVFDIMAYVPEDTIPLVDIFKGRVGRFVHVSTASVYKFANVFPWKEHFECVTDAKEGEYGYRKRQIEHILLDAYESHGFPASIIRPGYIFGPNNPVYREAMFFDRVVKNRPVLLPGNGNTLIQFGYVGDLARLLILAAEKHEAVGETFNFAGELAYTFDDYAKSIFDAVGRPGQIVHFEPREYALQPAEVAKVFPYIWQQHLIIDSSKAHYVLGYTEQVSLVEGLREAYKWYVQENVERTCLDTSLEDEIIRQQTQATSS